ncbi:hypothetical protein WJX81_003677 [Elliptochloris bilobata]|uniref:Homologous-pairing protein 2 homolog n=1 Tax=Elliptochloris bilobata TaxID=381761 RepID=A0AAW1S0S4_9CHLO
MAEERVLQFLTAHSRPWNALGVSDHLAQFGIKKPQVQRALDTLCEGSKITCKEFGKAKIYLPLQPDEAGLSKEELEALQQSNAVLQEVLRAASEDVASKEKELQGLSCSLTVEQLDARSAELTEQLAEVSKRLGDLRAGAKLVSPAERAALEKAFAAAMGHWAKRRRIFRGVWDQVSENIDQNVRELWEEIGVETDEAAGADLSALQQLLPAKRARH